MMRFFLGCLTVVAFTVGSAHAQKDPKPLRVGIIGLDTSHVVAFTKIINGSDEGALRNVKVTAAFPAGSHDLSISADRIKGFTKTLREKYNVEIVDSIPALLKKVDAVLLESVDGRPLTLRSSARHPRLRRSSVSTSRRGKPVIVSFSRRSEIRIDTLSFGGQL